MNSPARTDSERVNAVCVGEGRPVLLIHGLAASLNDWRPHMQALSAAGYRACALDLLGHGESAKPTTLDYRMEDVSRHFEGWVDSLRLSGPAVLIGHSLGGYLALVHAMRFPEQVSGLVLAAPFYTLDQLPWFTRRIYRRKDLNAMLIGRTPDWLLRLVIDLTSLMMGRTGGSLHALPEPVRAQTAFDYRRAAPGIYHLPNTIRDLTPDLGRVRAPTLLLWGQHDQTLAPDSFLLLRDGLPNVVGAQAMRAGHVLHQSHVPEFMRLVLGFLAEIRGLERSPGFGPPHAD